MTRAPKLPIRRRPGERPPRPPIPLTAEAIVASAALFLSLISLSSSALFAMRGSVVTAVPPDSVFFYRDAGKGAVLTAGVETALVNSASANYGDVVTRITMEIDTPAEVDPVFDYETLFTPVLSETAERQAADCPADARCVRNGRFLAMRKPGERWTSRAGPRARNPSALSWKKTIVRLRARATALSVSPARPGRWTRCRP